jgi:hypothetical protein
MEITANIKDIQMSKFEKYMLESDSAFVMEILVCESFGKPMFIEFKSKFASFRPTFKHDGKTVTFDVDRMDKDGLLIHLNTFLNKVGKRIKQDLGDLGAYRLDDDNIVVVKQPKDAGKMSHIELKFSY